MAVATKKAVAKKPAPAAKKKAVAKKVVAPAPEVVPVPIADRLGAAIAAIAEIDLRTIKDPALRAQVKDARVLLVAARRGLK